MSKFQDINDVVVSLFLTDTDAVLLKRVGNEGKDIIECFQSKVEDILLRDGMLLPHVILANANEAILVRNLNPFFESEATKDLLVKMLRLVAVKLTATDFVMATEAWACERGVGDDMSLSPAEDPKHRETLVVFRESDANSFVVSKDIVRDGEKIKELGEPKSLFQGKDEANKTEANLRFSGIIVSRQPERRSLS